jgi:serine/threonine protein kinase
MNSLMERERQLFLAALEEADPEARKRFLDQACADDPSLRANLDKLLRAHTQSDRFFGGMNDLLHQVVEEEQAREQAAFRRTASGTKGHLSPALSYKGGEGEAAEALGSKEASPDSPDTGASADAELTGGRIGSFTILQRLGEGGCGVVFLAEQLQPIRRRVALKIIKLGMDTKAVIARFQQESQALALMDHPNIARVLDAGATDSGRPYFVMELVHGTRITDYCDQHRLNTTQRLDLFIQVCHAIQHAHQKGIIHRDIKPSNVLVSVHDGVPVPKVIDFGIAKATGEASLGTRTLSTALGLFVGTPAYMSPEQAELSGLDVDTRSDIYSLGVLLYELLTGATPFDQKELLQSGIDQMRRTLQEKEPHRPSTKLNTLHGTELTQAAERRQTEPPKLRSQLIGDLDWIVMKALEKDRARRYETANALATDIQHHLNNEPVMARPPSRVYRFRKLVHRNKILFAAIAAVLFALLAGLGTSMWLFHKERLARQRAVEAEQQQIRLREEADRLRLEAEQRQKLTEANSLLSWDKLQEADNLIEGVPVSRANLEYATVFRTLGDWQATQGHWKAAADRLGMLVTINQPDDWDTATLDYLRYGPILVELRNWNTYNEFRNMAYTRYAGTTNPVAAERVVKISLLTPASRPFLESLRPLATIAAKSLDGSHKVEVSFAAWRAYSLALMEYRADDYAQALSWCRASTNYQNSNLPRSANVHLIMALCNYRQEHFEQAQEELDKGRDIIERRKENEIQVGNGAEGFWFDWLFARIMLREASGMIEGQRPPR